MFLTYSLYNKKHQFSGSFFKPLTFLVEVRLLLVREELGLVHAVLRDVVEDLGAHLAALAELQR